MPEKERSGTTAPPAREPASEEKPRQAGERGAPPRQVAREDEGSTEFVEGEEVRGLPEKVHGAVDLDPGPRRDS